MRAYYRHCAPDALRQAGVTGGVSAYYRHSSPDALRQASFCFTDGVGDGVKPPVSSAVRVSVSSPLGPDEGNDARLGCAADRSHDLTAGSSQRI